MSISVGVNDAVCVAGVGVKLTQDWQALKQTSEAVESEIELKGGSLFETASFKTVVWIKAMHALCLSS